MLSLWCILFVLSFHHHDSLRFHQAPGQKLTEMKTDQGFGLYTVEYLTQILSGPEQMFSINGEPKSGTTWFEIILDGIMQHGCKEVGNCKYSKGGRTSSVQQGDERKQVTALDHKHYIPGVGHSFGFDFSMPPKMSDAEISEAASRGLNNYKTNWLPIFRDPRSVLVSSCLHQQSRPDCNAFARLNMKASVGWINLRYAYFSSIVSQDKTRAKITFFESLKSGFRQEVRNVAKYLKLQLSDHAIATLEEETSLHSMKVAEAHGLVPKGGAKHGKVRSGETCGFNEALGEDTIQEITDYMNANMKPQLRRMFC